MSEPLSRVLATAQHDFPVVDEGSVVGMLGREAMLKALAAHGPAVPIGEVMRPIHTLLHPSDNLEDAFMKIMRSGEALAVVDTRGAMVGMLTSDNMADFFMIRQALDESASNGALSRARLAPS